MKELVIERDKRIDRFKLIDFFAFLDIEYEENKFAHAVYSEEIILGGRYQENKKACSVLVVCLSEFEGEDKKIEDKDLLYCSPTGKIKFSPITDYETIKKIDIALEKIIETFKSEETDIITRVFLDTKKFYLVKSSMSN